MKFLINNLTSYRWISCLYQSEVFFFVAESGKETAGKESKSTDHENPEGETGSDSVETSWSWVFILLIVLSIMSIIGGLGLVVFYCRRKKNPALSFSSVLTEDKTRWLIWHFRPKSFYICFWVFLLLATVLSCYIVALYTVIAEWDLQIFFKGKGPMSLSMLLP